MSSVNLSLFMMVYEPGNVDELPYEDSACAYARWVTRYDGHNHEYRIYRTIDNYTNYTYLYWVIAGYPLHGIIYKRRIEIDSRHYTDDKFLCALREYFSSEEEALDWCADHWMENNQ